MLAEHGSRGLTHGQVDRFAGVPEGTTSYYYRTRAALLRGVGKRVAEIDVANLQSVIDEPVDPQSPFAHLARLDHDAGRRSRADAQQSAPRTAAGRRPRSRPGRNVAGVRRPDHRHGPRRHRAPAARHGDPRLLEAQTTAVTTFIAGVFTRLAAGDRNVEDAEQLGRLLEAVATAVALTAQRS